MKKLIIANWKMNPETIEQARLLVTGLEHRMHQVLEKTDVVICPPFTFLAPLSHYSHLTKIGAQNVSWAASGAFTGEISANMLKNWKTQFVILGHSERRLYLGETDSMVNAKIIACLNAKLTPVVCLGGEEGALKADMKSLVSKQFLQVIKGLDKKHIEKIIFVYEPIWAISTMKGSTPATGEHAEEFIEYIRSLVAKKIAKDRAADMQILYGGTVNRDNVHDFARFPRIDGVLVGASSLDRDNFWEIINEFARESIHKS
ncbi:MAG: triose-phosphate isomerase [Candidatus Doudnabacteria bacterium]|nr:triose-phosphate isomerase [Candidatus Doudnabacteria bacterium]